jgi:hypothetical protein
MKRSLIPLVFSVLLFVAAPASAQQVIGTFQWQLQPYGSVMHLTVSQVGDIFTIAGFEAQCGGNASLPVSGVAVPQDTGLVFLGLTSINENGRGLHTRAYVNLVDFDGVWSDNANNNNQVFKFNPGNTCPGGPRTGPSNPDKAPQ